ncbi:hypothetical protein [Streptomyces sp. NPDC003006]
MDPDPGGTPSVLRTALAAWSAIDEGATHQLVVQDDMVLSESLFERARSAIEEMPDAALALFALWDSRNGAAVRLGAMAGARWVGAVNEYFPCVAVILPRRVADGFVEYGRSRLGGWPDDILMYRYLREQGVPRYVSVPNLAEHEDRGSISGNAFRGPRRSVCFLPSDRPGREGLRLTGMNVIPFFKHGVAQCAVRVTAPGPQRWLHLDCERYLEGAGVPAGLLRPSPGRAGAGAEASSVRGTWLTAFTMGWVDRRDGHRPAPHGPGVSPDPAVLAEALATIGPGGISHTRTEEQIAARREELSHVARDGMEAGREAAERVSTPRTSRRTPSRVPSRVLSRTPSPAGRVAVLGAATPLGEHVVRGLADRGHPVTAVASVLPFDEPGWGAVVDLKGLEPGPRGAAARLTVRLLTGPDGTPPADPVTYVLHPGDVYGPGCSRDTPIGRMVWNALRSQPVVVDEDPDSPLYPLHVSDLTEAVSLVLRTPPAAHAAHVLTLAGPKPCTVADMAEAVCGAVRPVGIETAPIRSVGPRRPPAADGAPPDGWAPTTGLRRGLHSFAQWLAYEGTQLIPD